MTPTPKPVPTATVTEPAPVTPMPEPATPEQPTLDDRAQPVSPPQPPVVIPEPDLVPPVSTEEAAPETATEAPPEETTPSLEDALLSPPDVKTPEQWAENAISSEPTTERIETPVQTNANVLRNIPSVEEQQASIEKQRAVLAALAQPMPATPAFPAIVPPTQTSVDATVSTQPVSFMQKLKTQIQSYGVDKPYSYRPSEERMKVYNPQLAMKNYNYAANMVEYYTPREKTVLKQLESARKNLETAQQNSQRNPSNISLINALEAATKKHAAAEEKARDWSGELASSKTKLEKAATVLKDTEIIGESERANINLDYARQELEKAPNDTIIQKKVTDAEEMVRATDPPALEAEARLANQSVPESNASIVPQPQQPQAEPARESIFEPGGTGGARKVNRHRNRWTHRRKH